MRDPTSIPTFKKNLNLLEEYFPKIAQPVSSTPLPEPLQNEDAVQLLYSSKHAFPRYFIVMGNCPSFLYSLLQSHKTQLYRLVWIAPDPQSFTQSLYHTQLLHVLNDNRTRIMMADELHSILSLLREDNTGIGIWGVNVYGNPSHDSQAEILELIQQTETVAKENASIQYQQGPDVQKNIIANLPYIMNATVLDQWENRYSQPAVVVGAGPSLDRNLHALRQSSTKPLTVCVDTALKLLLQNGIEPDFVVSCDPTALNARHFKEVKLPPKTVFAFLPEIHRSVLPMLRHPHILCLHDTNSKLLDTIMQPLALQTTFSRGMNVGFCAYSLARVLGCSPIILAGMDLALEAGKSSHAQGTANASDVNVDVDKGTVHLTGNVHTNKSKVVETAGYHGETVTTFPHFHIVLQRFAQDMTAHNTPVINATEGGAHIPGTDQLPLSQALLQHSTIPKQHADFPSSRLNSILIEKTLNHLKRYLKELDHTRQTLERGAYRIRQWLQEMQNQPVDAQTVQSQAEALLQRWQDILNHPVLDECLDIGLAPMRFDTYRIIPPQTDHPSDRAKWWHDWLLAHFQAMRDETELYIQLFGGTVQKLIVLQNSGINNQSKI